MMRLGKLCFLFSSVWDLIVQEVKVDAMISTVTCAVKVLRTKLESGPIVKSLQNALPSFCLLKKKE